MDLPIGIWNLRPLICQSCRLEWRVLSFPINLISLLQRVIPSWEWSLVKWVMHHGRQPAHTQYKILEYMAYFMSHLGGNYHWIVELTHLNGNYVTSCGRNVWL
jgi:hypothetical protein